MDWRNAYLVNAKRISTPRPTDAAFAEAEQVLLDPSSTPLERKQAALRGVPPIVPFDSCFPMWIPAKFLTATFSDTEIMTSLGTEQQPAEWTNAIPYLRDFKCIRNAGISFLCTDREICIKLGNVKLSICNKEFKVQPYSKYSHWYYVDLQRVPDDVNDEIIYDWFMSHGTLPAFITPLNEINGLKSCSRRVYFNRKDPPASLMIDPKTPVREIEFTASGYCVVQHRIKAFNKEVPPFLKAIKSRQKETQPNIEPAQATVQAAVQDTVQATVQDTVQTIEQDTVQPARSTSENISSDQDMDGKDSSDQGSDYRNSSDESMDSGDLSNGSDSESDSGTSAITIKPKSIWTTTDHAVVLPRSAFVESEDVFVRVQNSKHRFFPELPTASATEVTFECTDSTYSWAATHNSFDILATGSDKDPIATDVDLTLLTEDKKPIYSRPQRSAVATEVLVSAYSSFDVETMSLDALCKYLEEFAEHFLALDETDSVLATIQAQPSSLRPFYDTTSPDNYALLTPVFLRHAILRVLGNTPMESASLVFEERLAMQVPGIVVNNVSPTDVLLDLCGKNSDLYWLQLYLAEFDIFLQVHAPSIYNDPLKVCELTQSTRCVLPYTLWHLWDEKTLSDLLQSPLTKRLMQAKLPETLRKTISTLFQLQQNAANTAESTL
jgi:hypothetical protein